MIDRKIHNKFLLKFIKNFFVLYLGKSKESSSSSESDEEINDYNSYFSIDSRLFFENSSGNAFSVYKCLLTNKKVTIVLIYIQTYILNNFCIFK